MLATRTVRGFGERETTMTQRIFGALAVVVLTAAGVQAQPRNCAPRDQVVTRLAAAYGETRHAVGLGAGGRMIEVFASGASGSWTITVTDPAGLTCLVASGQAFEAVAERPAAPGRDA